MAAARQVLAGLAADLFEDSSESDNDSVENEERVPFEIQQIPERLLFQRTRLDRRVFRYVLEVIGPAIEKNTKKGRYSHITPAEKLYVALQFYATGTYQWLVGSSGGISQSAACHAIREVTNALVGVAPQFIRFPGADEYTAVKQAFYNTVMARHGKGFPNVLGAIDCTHVRIQKPSMNPEQYLNRHIYHSINVQLITGPDLTIYNLLARFPGSNHDSYIWTNSGVRTALSEGNFVEGWLIGDSGYPQEPWLMVPVANPTTPAEQLYNTVHISTRNVVERTNGVLKSRWHVLDSPLAYSPTKVCSIITACGVLHNICTKYNLDVEDLQIQPQNDDCPFQGPLRPDYDHYRRDLILRHFTQ